LLLEGDTIDSSVEVVEAANLPNGKRISVKGILSKQNVPLAEIYSQFFFPGIFHDFSSTFRKKEVKKAVHVANIKVKAILESKPWFHLLPGAASIHIG
jgi:fatty acid synthase subunit beta